MGDLSHRFEEVRVLDGELAPVRAGRLHDDGGDVGVLGQVLVEGVGVGLDDGDGGTGLVGDAVGRGYPRLDGDVVVPAVVVLPELDEPRLAGVPASEADRQQGGLRAAGGETHSLGGGHEAGDELRPAHLVGSRGAHVGAVPDLSLDGLGDFRPVVAENQGAEADEVVDELVAVNVPLHGSIAPPDVEGVGVHDARLGCPARDDLLASRVELGGLLVGLVEPFEDGRHVVCPHR